jgi:photosystem II stability/assembly factor-like uncharacterized protein
LSSYGIGGVYQSNNGGITWEHIGLESQSVYTLNFSHNGNLLAGTGQPPGIYLYDMEQELWENVFSANDNILAIEPGFGDVIFSVNNKIHSSNDDGYTWETLFDVQSTSKDIAVYSKDTVYVGSTIIYGGELGGVSRSINGGVSWQRIGLEYHYIESIALTSNGDLYAGGIGQHYYGWGGVYKLSNGSQTWDTLTYWPRIRSMVVTDEDVIYCGYITNYEAWGGVMHSSDYGETWVLDSSGMGEIGIKQLVLDNHEKLYALSNGTTSRLFRSILPVSTNEFTSNIKTSNSYCVPNPFYQKARIYFDSPNKNEPLILKVFSIEGKCIKHINLDYTDISQGYHELQMANNKVGLYIYTISGSNYYTYRKFLLTTK